MTDQDQLDRFLSAQRETYDRALAEVAAGAKRSHWMWYIFPQLAGLGQSPMARRYAISGLDEAKAYLAHPVLGARLLEITAVLQGLSHADPERVFGDVDAMKLKSSLTLFARAGGAERGAPFREALGRWFGGQEDQATVSRL